MEILQLTNVFLNVLHNLVCLLITSLKHVFISVQMILMEHQLQECVKSHSIVQQITLQILSQSCVSQIVLYRNKLTLKIRQKDVFQTVLMAVLLTIQLTSV